MKTLSNDEFRKLMEVMRSSGRTFDTDEVKTAMAIMTAEERLKRWNQIKWWCNPLNWVKFAVKNYTLPWKKFQAWRKQRLINKLAVDPKAIEAIFSSNRSEICQSFGLLCESPIQFKTNSVLDGETIPHYMRPEYSRKVNGKYPIAQLSPTEARAVRRGNKTVKKRHVK